MENIVLNDAELATVSGGDQDDAPLATQRPLLAAQGELLPTGSGSADPNSVLPSVQPTPTS